MVAIVPGQGERSAGKEVNRDTRIATLNVGTMRNRSNEIVEMLSRRLVDICYVQESRWKGESALNTAGRYYFYKFFWKGDDFGSGGVGVLVARKWIDNVISVVRHCTRLIMLRLLCGKSIINFVCVYAPQPDLSAEEKYRFYQQLLVLVPSVAPSETRMTSMVMLVSIAMVSVDIRVVIVMEHGIRKE